MLNSWRKMMLGIVPLLSLFVGVVHSAEPVPVVATADAQFTRMRTMIAGLPKEYRPVEVRQARNGAWYALLPNGAELILYEKRNAPVVSVQAWFRTGAVDEQEWLGSGMSHYCEHLMFKGTKKRPTGFMDQEIRGAGGDDNAYTSSDRTVYHVTADSANWSTSFDVVADMVMNSSFPEEEVKKEHGVVTKEIEISKDNPDSAIWDAFARTVYQVHPYSVPVLGYPDRFARVTRDEVWAYYQRRYTPQMCAFVVVGDLDALKALPQMAQTVSAWKRSSVNPPTIPVEPEQVSPRETRITHPLCQVPKLYMGYPTVALRHPDLYALDVLASILGDGRSSRLYREIEDKQKLAQDVSAFNYTPKYPGFFGVTSSIEADKFSEAKTAILNLIEQARTTLPTPEELERAKRKVQARKVYGEMTAEGIAESLGSGWFDAGDLDFSQTYVDGIKSVKPEDVRRVALAYLDPRKLNVTLLLPEDKVVAKAENAKKITAAAASSFEAWVKQNADWATANRVVSVKSQELNGLPVSTVKFANGLRLVVREDTSLPATYASITLLGGQRWEMAKWAGSGNLLSEMLTRGTQLKTKDQVAAITENLGAELTSFGGRNSLGLNLHSLKADFPAMLELAAECLLTPAFNPEELEGVRRQVLNELSAQDEDIGTINFKLARSLLYAGHPYARPVKGTKEIVEKVPTGILSQLYGQWLRPDNMVMGISGDCTAKEAAEWVGKGFSKLKAGEEFTPPATPMEALSGQKMGQKSIPGAEGTVVSLAFRGVKLGDPDRETLDVIAGLLSGLGGRISVVIREQLGMAYSVGVSNDSQLDGGSVIFYVQTEPKHIEKAKEVFWAEIKKLQESPVSEKELTTVKKFLAGSEKIDLQNQNDVAQKLAIAELYGESAETVFKRAERVEKVTSKMVQDAARKYFDEKNNALVVVKPAEEAKK